MTPLGSVVVAAIENVSAVAMAARATGTVTETAPDDEEDEDEELDEDVDDDELDIELDIDEEVEDDDEDEVDEDVDDDIDVDEEPFDPPPPQAGRIAATSMPTIRTGPVRNEQPRSRITGDLQHRADRALLEERRGVC